MKFNKVPLVIAILLAYQGIDHSAYAADAEKPAASDQKIVASAAKAPIILDEILPNLIFAVDVV